MDAYEEDLGDFGHSHSLDLGESPKALACEPFGQERHVVLDGGGPGQVDVGLRDEPFDGLNREHADDIEDDGVDNGANGRSLGVPQLLHAVTSVS